MTLESIPQSFRTDQAGQPEPDAAELPPAHSTRFKGTKIPITFAVRHKKKKD